MPEATRGQCCWPLCRKFRKETIPLCQKHAEEVWIDLAYDMRSTLGLGAAVDSINVVGPLTYRAKPPANPTPRGHVYFIQFGDRIKIGYSENLASRLAALPHDRVIATVKGTVGDERMCHAVFHHLRVKGEWFMAAPELIKYAESLAS